MRKHVKCLALFVSIILMVGLFVGCGNENKKADTEDDKLTIGFIPMTLDNEYFITMVNAAKQEAANQNIDLLVQAGQRHGSAEEQLQLVENMISREVDAICIVPSSSEGLTSALKKAQDAGIPVINIDTRLDGELSKEIGLDTIPFIGTDNYDGAKMAGKYALEVLDEGAKVAILTGISGQQNAADRRNGFYDVVKDKVEVVAEQSANWEVEQGYNVTQNILQANPELDLIFASNDGMGLGAQRAVKEADRDIVVVGFDAVNEALNSIEKDEMNATIAQFPAKMGIQGVQTAVKLINGEEVSENTNTGTQLILKKDVAEFKDYLSQYAD